MKSWTKALLALMVVWAVGVTAATQNGRPARQVNGATGQFRGQVSSASGAVTVGGPATNPGHPVSGATVHLVPVTAIDTTTRITASAIYAPPYPAEDVDEPLEDAIRLRGAGFPQAKTDARGNFVVAAVPDGKYFVHVTPAPTDAEHLPGGDVSRRSYPAEQLRGQSMAIKVSSRPSAAARYTGSSACLACHKDRQHYQQTAHKLGWTVPQSPARTQDFSRHPDYFKALESFPEADGYTGGTRLELGDYDATRGDDKFKLRAYGDARLPIENAYADVYLWRNKADRKYYVTMVNRLNPRDPNSPAHLEIKLLYGGAVHDQRYIVSVPPGLAERQSGTRCCATT